MCTIAGYIGTKRAAPILVEMLKKEEYYNAGFYSGIATIHEGKLYYAKLTGDTDRLVALTNAMDLPGNVGIIHGRTRSGGGDLWAQPFIGTKNGNGDPYVAYVANGSQGYFSDEVEKSISPIAAELYSLGYGLPSKCKIDAPRYATLPDGDGVHSSEVMAQQIMRYIDSGENLSKAMERSFTDMPGEIVGLAIALSEPDRIAFARINQPMNVSHSEHGTYIGSTSICFPEDAGEAFSLPCMSYGNIYNGKAEILPFEKPVCKIAPISAEITHRAYDFVFDSLSKEKISFMELYQRVKSLFDHKKYDCTPAAHLTYETVKSMIAEGVIKTEVVTVDGVFEGITAPQILLWI
ncbi:MAG: hypothetical protein E7583_01350 [Ruminococcaceae bacterium]|nr:hypothetical protein [Oscillospiraceae bacterium]